MSITPVLSQDILIFDYKMNVGHALTTVLALGGVTVYLVKKTCFLSGQNKPILSEEAFWDTVKDFPTMINEKEPIMIGRTAFSNLSVAQREIALSCTKISDYVKTFLVQSSFEGSVLDLGCGVGANAIPLIAKGCQVTAIDKEKSVITAYNANKMSLFIEKNLSPVNHLQEARSIVGDITEESYPENIDAVICVDTLPFIRPSKLKATMDKIFQALRPGGQFVGTLFFQPKNAKDPLVEEMGKLGAYFYPDKNFAREIITRSGFQIMKETERRYGGFFSHSHCLEFLAVKPDSNALLQPDTVLGRDIQERRGPIPDFLLLYFKR